MKKLFTLCSLIAVVNLYAQSGGVGIGTTTPNAGAALEIKNTNKALLLPRLTSASLNGIATAIEGMTAYDVDKHNLVGYTSSAAEAITQNIYTLYAPFQASDIAAQSFTAPSTFLLRDIGVVIDTKLTTIFTMTVYSGTGTAGTSLGSTTLSVNGATGFQFQYFNFSNANVTLQNGQVYTFAITGNQSGSNSPDIAYSSTSVYAGGNLIYDNVPSPNYDAGFQIRTNGVGGWQPVLMANQTTAGTLTLNGGNADVFTLLNGGDVRLYNDAGTGSALFYATGGTGANNSVFTVASDGKNFSFNGTGGSVSSDRRLKQNITPLHNSLKKIMQLNGYSYRFKTKAADPRKEIGVLAQEVRKVLPDAVFTDDKGMYSVSYNSLVPLLINSVKEQQAEIEKLKQQLNKTVVQKNQNDRLAKRIEQLEAIVLKQSKANESLSRK